MADVKSNRFTKYFPLLLDALRSTDPSPMRPAEAMAWIRAQVQISQDDLTRNIVGGGQSIFENDVHWARFYLVKAGLLNKSKRGYWGLTDEGRTARLSEEETLALYTSVRDSNRTQLPVDEDAVIAPGASDESEAANSYWLVGACFNKTDDQTPRFLAESIWENGHEDQFLDLVRSMKPGDSIVIKSSFAQKSGLPFDIRGQSASVMRIKAIGTILENPGDGKKVRVAWDPPFTPRDWYFFTYRRTIAKLDVESEEAHLLRDFIFRGEKQDYEWWLKQPYWSDKYKEAKGVPDKSKRSIAMDEIDPEVEEDVEEELPYTLDDIIQDGCFLGLEELSKIYASWDSKKNLIIQGPPGTGKTWLAKRLAYVRVGSKDRETERSRLRVVQFHPSLAYEDFVRGWRPGGDGRLALVDGILMQAIEAAVSEPDVPFVLVIEEINRGNPAQIFGEMLTLLENTKRHVSEAMELAYRKKAGERVYVPENLFIIGTMNVADRSLAIVDLALRRRFAFVDLEPKIGVQWRAWCVERGIEDAICSEIESRISALNADITTATSLGLQFRVGHSFVTPDVNETIRDGRAWFRAKVETEIGPLLDEYWYDAPEVARDAKAKLLARLG